MKYSTVFAFILVAAPVSYAQDNTESLPTVIPTLGPRLPAGGSLSFPLSVVSSGLPSASGSITASATDSVPISGSGSGASISTTAPSAPLPSGSVPVSGSVSGSPPAPSTSAPNAALAMAPHGVALSLGAGILAAVLV
ncbi:hypothetical protein C8R43DRAFT_1135445 [Mycena crocata]|nr:hypothetical protein C8R43DRAFT_1135445 [Mycena crocata]